MKIAVCGIKGKMGQAVVEEAQNRNIEVVFGIDKTAEDSIIPVYDKFSDAVVRPDCLIDFSDASSVFELLGYALTENVPLIIGTTGQSEEGEKAIKKASERIPIIYKHNLAVGFDHFKKIVAFAQKLLTDEDKVLVETHHSKKKDAPSGSALELSQILGTSDICSIRIGHITGRHTALFAVGEEIIELSHTALSRKVFAQGAVSYAEKLFCENLKKTKQQSFQNKVHFEPKT